MEDPDSIKVEQLDSYELMEQSGTEEQVVSEKIIRSEEQEHHEEQEHPEKQEHHDDATLDIKEVIVTENISDDPEDGAEEGAEDDTEEGTEEGIKEDLTEMGEFFKQIADIMEHNDIAEHEASLAQYNKTETADKAAINSIVQKQRSNASVYTSQGFQTIEFFPKKYYWQGYIVVLDGHRLYLNTRRKGGCVYRCKYQDKGCAVRIKIIDGDVQKINEHDHSGVPGGDEIDNYHFKCIYCNLDFDDLELRKTHMLNESHINAPWPLDEDLCIFAEYDVDKLQYQPEWDEPEPIDKAVDRVGAKHKPLPNKTDALKRVFISKERFIGVYRPGETVPPVYPERMSTPHGYQKIIRPVGSVSSQESTPVRACTPDSVVDENVISTPPGDGPILRYFDEFPITKIPRLVKQIYKQTLTWEERRTPVDYDDPATLDGDPATLDDDPATLDGDRVPKSPETVKPQYNETVIWDKRTTLVENHDTAPPEDYKLKITNAHVKKAKKRKSECAEQVSPKRRTTQALIDDETDNIPQLIDNVVEEYENKVVLHCDICDVNLKTLKHRADHALTKHHIENKRLKLEEDANRAISLTFDKPIFTKEFLEYNKALEAELRIQRKGAVELEEQNAVLASHILELRDVVKELNNAKQLMQTQHNTLEQHLKNLKSQLSTVFGNVLSTTVSTENFNETFNKLSMAMTGTKQGSRNPGSIKCQLKKNLKQAQIDTVML